MIQEAGAGDGSGGGQKKSEDLNLLQSFYELFDNILEL